MVWYTASLLVRVRLAYDQRARDEARDILVLLRARNAADAWHGAVALGGRYQGLRLEDGTTVEFAGVHRITVCRRGAGDPRAVEILGPGVELAGAW